MNSERGDPRVPEAFDEIQDNFCKNARYPNVGASASTEEQPQGSAAREGRRDSYAVKGLSGHKVASFGLNQQLERSSERSPARFRLT